MRIRIAGAVITVAALGAIPLMSSHHETLPETCKAAQHLSSYRTQGMDGMMTVPSGKAFVKELQEMHASDKRMSMECDGYLFEWATDHSSVV